MEERLRNLRLMVALASAALAIAGQGALAQADPELAVDRPVLDGSGEVVATETELPPAVAPEYALTRVRISPEIGERAEEIAAFVESRAGWTVGEPADFAIAPNPEFFEDLMFHRIKRVETDLLRRNDFRFFFAEPMELADLLEYYGSGWQLQHSWASNVPVPVDLGETVSPELFGHLEQAMKPEARTRALIRLGTMRASASVAVCISNEPSAPGMCPMSQHLGWGGLSRQLPVFFQARAPGEFYHHLTVIAIAPDGRIVPLIDQQAVTEEVTDAFGGQAVETVGGNNDQPIQLEQPGIYHFISIMSVEPIDPRIWLLRPDQPSPAGMCETPNEQILCDAMRGLSDRRRILDLPVSVTRVMLSQEIFPTERMVGGSAARRDEGRWQAQLFMPREGSAFATSGGEGVGRIQRMNFEKAHKCGGSYIASGIILTAAHCLKNRALDDMQVRLGTLDIANGGSNFAMHSIVMHEDYGKPENNADIAIIRIKPDSRLNRLLNRNLLAEIDLAPVSLPRQQDDVDLLVTGWGFTLPSAPGNNSLTSASGALQRNSQELMKLELDWLASSECKQFSQFRSYNGNDIVCARSPDDGRGTCYGDSGGPLTKEITANRRQLVGIVAASIGCAQADNPGLYTRVASYRGWITRAIAKSNEKGIHRIR